MGTDQKTQEQDQVISADTKAEFLMRFIKLQYEIDEPVFSKAPDRNNITVETISEFIYSYFAEMQEMRDSGLALDIYDVRINNEMGRRFAHYMKWMKNEGKENLMKMVKACGPVRAAIILKEIQPHFERSAEDYAEDTPEKINELIEMLYSPTGNDIDWEKDFDPSLLAAMFDHEEEEF